MNEVYAQHKKMKKTGDDFLNYLLNVLKSTFTKFDSISTIVIIGVAILVIGFKYEGEAVVDVFLVFSSGLLITHILSEFVLIFLTRQTNKNKWILCTIIGLILVILDCALQNEKQQYWCVAVGLIFFIPVNIVLIFSRLRT